LARLRESAERSNKKATSEMFPDFAALGRPNGHNHFSWSAAFCRIASLVLPA
jgi:hypothetical protein